MDSRAIILLMTAILTYLIGLIGTTMTSLPQELNILPAGTPATVLTVIVFGFGFMFFGYILPLMTFLAGIFVGNSAAASTGSTPIIAQSLSIMLISFASVNMGVNLLEDMAEKGNFKETVKISAICILAALAIGLLADFGIFSF